MIVPRSRAGRVGSPWWWLFGFALGWIDELDKAEVLSEGGHLGLGTAVADRRLKVATTGLIDFLAELMRVED